MRVVLLIGVLLFPPMPTGRSQNATAGSSSFNFILRYGSCWTSELDTAKGMFTYDPFGSSRAVVDLKLTGNEMDQIQKRLESMDFWNPAKFPEVFRIPNNSNIGCGHGPLRPIFIAVTRGGIEKKLSWDDGDSACQLNNEAKALRELESLIISTIQSKPEYRTLPQETRGCV